MKESRTLNNPEKLDDLIEFLGQLIKDLELENIRLRRELRKYRMKWLGQAFPNQRSDLLM